MKIKDFLNKPMDGFTIQELTELYLTNDDGRKIKSVGFFHNENIAKAFATIQIDANWHETEKVFVLTNGKVGFLVGKIVTLIDEEKAAAKIKEKALTKLTAEERKMLSL